ncbi:unnamed protein product [Musa hybrid cultivar]
MDEVLTAADVAASNALAGDALPPSLSSNLPLVSALLAFSIAQFLKLFTTWYKEKRWDSKRLLGSGGMPSSHSATVAALAMAIGLQEGLHSSSFALAVTLATIVMYDASGIRLHAGRQAEVLNHIVCELPPEHPVSNSRPLRELLGHTPLQDRLIFGFPSPADLHHDDAAAAAALPPSSPPASPNAIPVPGSPGPNPLSSAAADAWLSDPCAARWKTNLHRSRTAPAMSAINEVGPSRVDSPGRPSIIAQAFLLLVVYLAFGVAVYTFNRHHFTAAETHPVVDALYFCIVTMCTIGYGDITPTTASAKIFSITFVIIGFGFVDILLSGMVSYVLDLQESLLLSAQDHHHHHHHRHEIARNYIIDVKKGRMRIRMKVALALGVVLLCIGLGTGVLRFVERLGWLDSFYLSVMSVTTVGYGDRAFKTMPGRLFASLWLLVSTLAVARAFLYLAEARIDKRHRKIAKWVLSRDMTVSEFLAADIDNNGFVTRQKGYPNLILTCNPTYNYGMRAFQTATQLTACKGFAYVMQLACLLATKPLQDDPELEEIRQRRMQELMAKHGVGNQHNGEQQNGQEEAKREAEERRQLMLSQILSTQARERLARIALVKPEKARGVEDVLLRAAQMGQLSEKVSEERLISLLEQINNQTSKQTKVTIQRRRSVLEDDD